MGDLLVLAEHAPLDGLEANDRVDRVTRADEVVEGTNHILDEVRRLMRTVAGSELARPFTNNDLVALEERLLRELTRAKVEQAEAHRYQRILPRCDEDGRVPGHGVAA